MSDRNRNFVRKSGGCRDLVRISDIVGRAGGGSPQFTRAGTGAVPAYVAQVYGARVRRKRLELAREDAPAIHTAYRGDRSDSGHGERLDVRV